MTLGKSVVTVSFLFSAVVLPGCGFDDGKTNNTDASGPRTSSSDASDSGRGGASGSGGHAGKSSATGGEVGSSGASGAGTSGKSGAGGTSGGGRGGQSGGGGVKDAGAHKPVESVCCVAHPGLAGCEDKSVQDCVCGNGDPNVGVPECCATTTGWDATCVLMVSLLQCGICKDDCCTASTTSAGCSANPKIEKCVCNTDPKCCDADGGVWDDICRAEAIKSCGAICD